MKINLALVAAIVAASLWHYHSEAAREAAREAAFQALPICKHFFDDDCRQP